MELSSIKTKKELGQFFSGNAIAKLLSCLAESHTANDIIDPMCGIGDLLLGINTNDCPRRNLTGVEIDKSIFEIAQKRASDSIDNLINGNIFDPKVIKSLSSEGYDLVITNPPYIRYQELKEGKRNDNFSSDQIRKYLIKHLEHFKQIDQEEKIFLEKVIMHYSGLSDIAVPAWILCSMMVKKEGTLAMVVPEAWLSRNYALIIKYLLLSLFKIEYIIEDANSTWFSPAQIKTTLIVAKRISKQSIQAWTDNDFFIYASIYKTANSVDSLIGNIFPNSIFPEQKFIHFLKEGKSVSGFIDNTTVSLKKFSKELISTSKRQKGFICAEENNSKLFIEEEKSIKSTSSLKDWFGSKRIKFSFLEDIGVNVGQGLRTGANFFFYLDSENWSTNEIKLFPDKKYNMDPFVVDKKYTRFVVRKQTELDDSYSVNSFKINGVVLALQNYAIPEDIKYAIGCNSKLKHKYKELPIALIQYIRKASAIIIKERDNKKINELSAVKPNIKKWNEKKPDESPRFWYMLPDFSKRHSPELFVPRINNNGVKVRMNNKHFLIDANFSTIWTDVKLSKFDKYGLLSLLNSTLFLTLVEEHGTVMGGGALKLEATQIKSIPLPHLTQDTISVLNRYGKILSDSSDESKDIIEKIDRVIIIDLFGENISVEEKIMHLSSIRDNLINKRSKL